MHGVAGTFLVDTGAAITLLSKQYTDKLGMRTQPTDVRITTIDGTTLPDYGATEVGFDAFGAHSVLVVPNMTCDGILGSDFLSKTRATIDLDQGLLILDGRRYRLMNEAVTYRDRILGRQIGRVDVVTTAPRWMTDVIKHPVFREELGKCNVGPPMTVDAEGPPIKQRPYRQPMTKRHLVDTEIDKMLETGVIRPSVSPWASPITLVPKKDGTTRFCVDFRKVNARTRKDCYPLPNIQEIFDLVGGARYFTTLDVRAGYWQCELDERDRQKTAFVCHRGLFEFNRLAFGLANAPGQFQRRMDRILSGLIGKICFIYIDDIVIFSKNAEEHARHVQLVLDRIAAAGLTLKLSKCRFGQTEVDLLGFRLNGEGIAPQDDKADAIKNLPTPETAKDIRAFLGMAGYYRQCIPEFAKHAVPLNELTKKNVQFKWTDDCQRSFDRLKDLLSSDKVMIYPDVTQSYQLHTDASDIAVGAVLTQVRDGLDRPVQYVSKAFSGAQKKWTAITKEAYAIIYALKKLRPYLQGAEFTIFTDHKPLRSLFSCEMKNSMLQRWAMQISEFAPRIEYRKGRHNVRADMLSRIRWPAVQCASLQTTLTERPLGAEQQQEFPEEWAEALENEDGEGDYVLVGDELFSLKLPHRHAGAYPRVMLPEGRREAVIRDAHEEVGHKSWLPTLRYIQASTVWPGMIRNVKEQLKLCPHCQVNRPRGRATQLQITETAGQPFYRVGADLIGSLPITREGYKYLVTVIDHCTGYADAVPIVEKRASLVWEALREIFTRFGFPAELITDNGAEFVAAEIKDEYRKHGIKHIRTTPLRPQSNGSVERFHRTLRDTLRKCTNNIPRDWYRHLHAGLWAYRLSPQLTRAGRSPYEALYGQGPPQVVPWNEETREERMATARREVYRAQQAAKQRRQAAGPTFQKVIAVDDVVTVDDPAVPAFGSRRQHAFRVLAVRGKVVRVQEIRDGLRRPAAIRTFHVDRLHVVPPEIDWTEPNLSVFSRPDVRTTAHPETAAAATGGTAQGTSEPTSSGQGRRVVRRKRSARDSQQSSAGNEKRARIAARCGSFSLSSSEED